MVSVIAAFEAVCNLRYADSVLCRQVLDRLCETAFQFLLCYSAQGVVPAVHADILRLVEPAEDAHLCELCHSGEEHELEVGVCGLEYRVEASQYIFMPILQKPLLSVNDSGEARLQHVQQGFVVLVDEHHAPAARAFVRCPQHFLKTPSHTCVSVRWRIIPLPGRDCIFQNALQNTGFLEIASIEVYMEHRIFQPLFLQRIYGQSSEQFLSSEEIVFESGHQQALSESARAAQEVYLSLFH